MEVNVNTTTSRVREFFSRIFAFRSNGNSTTVSTNEAVKRRATSNNGETESPNKKTTEVTTSELKATETKPEIVTEVTVNSTTATTTEGSSLISIDELIKSRRANHTKKAREKRTLELNTIRGDPCPVDPTRPYGLPMEMEGSRRDVWEHVFEHVDDVDTICNLRFTCVMFMELLERKFKIALLTCVIANRVSNMSQNCVGDSKTRFQMLLNLRKVSKFSKTSVDGIMEGGLAGNFGRCWFQFSFPYYAAKFDTPYLACGSLGRGLERLQETIDYLKQLEEEGKKPAHFYLPFTFIINEVPENGLDADLRSKFETVLEKIGVKITSLVYHTKEKSFETYVNLARWLKYMPNLQDLHVQLIGPILLRDWEKCGRISLEPFTTCPNLKRYSEGIHGFGVPFLKEILRANPTIQEIILGDTSTNNWGSIKEELDNNLQITKFHCLCVPKKPLFQQPFDWSKQLTHLVFWDPKDRYISTAFDISSKEFFTFVSSCSNLLVLMVSTPHIQDTGGYLQLPNVEQVVWKLFPTFKTLEFLRDVESLKDLLLDVSECPDTNRREDLLRFLRKWHIPSLFPALEIIQVKTQKDANFKSIF